MTVENTKPLATVEPSSRTAEYGDVVPSEPPVEELQVAEVFPMEKGVFNGVKIIESPKQEMGRFHKHAMQGSLGHIDKGLSRALGLSLGAILRTEGSIGKTLNGHSFAEGMGKSYFMNPARESNGVFLTEFEKLVSSALPQSASHISSSDASVLAGKSYDLGTKAGKAEILAHVKATLDQLNLECATPLRGKQTNFQRKERAQQEALLGALSKLFSTLQRV